MRTDIQVMRAIAVLAVIGYHADFPVPGGFLGVDVFFAISGYVVASMLLQSFESRTPGGGYLKLILRFFKRRIARLAPALALVSVATLIVLYGFVGPIANVEVSAITAIAAAFGLANLTAAVNSGDYFNTPDNALLHLWSLGVEEQFYFFLPIVLVFLWSFRPSSNPSPYRRLEIFTWFVTFLSFCLAIIPEREIFSSESLRAVFGFYSPLVRVWEFGFGVGVFLLARRVSLDGAAGKFLGYFGFLFMVSSFFLVSSEQPTPGLTTLIPVAGTAMVLMGGAGWLSWKPFVKLGNLSYSLYLWHWPVIFTSSVLAPDNVLVRIFAIVSSLLLSVITYRFVEVPFRQLGKSGSWTIIPNLMGVALIPVVLAFAFFSYGDSYWRGLQQLGFPASHEGELGNEAHFELTANAFHPCGNEQYSKLAPVRFDLTICFQSEPAGEPTVAIIGDSHAEHLLAGFAQELPDHVTVAVVTNNFDGPVFASDGIDDVITALVADENLQVIVLAARWEYATWTPAELTSVSEKLISSGKTIFLASGSHTFSFGAEKCKYSNNLYWPSSRTCTEPLLDQSDKKADAWRWAEKNKIPLIDTETNLCPNKCSMVSDDGVMLMRDQHHFTLPGSRAALANQLGVIATQLANGADQHSNG